MATRTSSPPGSRSRSTSSSRSKSGGRGGSSTRTRGTKKKKNSKPAGRPAPRAVRNGTGPVARFFQALFRGVTAIWLGIAHAVGSAARGIGHTARDLDPEHRRDGVGLSLFGLAIVIAAAVWFEAPGGVLEFTRTVVSGTVGKVGWLVPLVVVLGGLAGDARSGAQRPGRPSGDRLVGVLLRRARPGAHRQRQPAAGQRRHHPAPRGRGSGRLRGVLAAARPAPLRTDRGAAAGAAGLLRGAGHHRDAALPGARAAGRRARPGPRPAP